MEIAITRGQVVLVDDEDFALVSGRKWQALPCRHGGAGFYAIRTDEAGGRKRSVLMHRLIAGVNDPSISIDHINGNGLDNRRSNLRIATASQNSANQRRVRNRHGLKGIYANGSHYAAKFGGTYLGQFKTSGEAARAYDAAALAAFGEFAATNTALGLLAEAAKK